MLSKVAWSGRWPNCDEYPRAGARIVYRHRSSGETLTGRIVSVWCGIEPCFELDNGDSVFPTLDPFAVEEDSLHHSLI